MSDLNLLTAFENMVEGSQGYFRLLLKAMSVPGTIIDPTTEMGMGTEIQNKIQKEVELKTFISTQTDSDEIDHYPIYFTTWAIAQTLLDSECKVYLSKTLATQELIQSIQFYTDAIITQNPREANFAFINLTEFHSVDEFNCGSIEAPHNSCTLIIQADKVSHQAQLILSGPGIKTTRSLAIDDLSQEQIVLLENNHQFYPCGVDVIFTTENNIVALPRSTTISTQEKE